MSNLFGRSLTIIAALILSACLDLGGKTVKEGDTEGDVVDPSKVICNPIDDYTPTFLERGLFGKLYYLEDDQPRYSSVDEFITNAHAIDADLYMNRLFVPTRPWDRGFHTMDGQLVTNPAGEALYEYFGIEVETELRLAPGQAPGHYQFAILADDGAIMRDAAGIEIVNNDGVHPTKMACASQSVYLEAATTVPVTIRYHQGPRFHIAMMILMRPFPADPAAVNDPQCGQLGNSHFFDSTTTPPTAKANYYGLLERGWVPLEGANYKLPKNRNPCVLQEQPLEISNVSLSGVTRNSVTVTWTTNVPASSKVWYKNTATGATSETAEDTALVTSHSVTVTGLTSNTLYSFRALSTTAGLQSGQSDERAVRTQR
ncbi:MAG TPA: fibronectin type III domain-containing protein [Bdellovibrionales bacterium]|nr:fibronectin type III domain-containing protein [Bdellovibrionales bacterium]